VLAGHTHTGHGAATRKVSIQENKSDCNPHEASCEMQHGFQRKQLFSQEVYSNSNQMAVAAVSAEMLPLNIERVRAFFSSERSDAPKNTQQLIHGMHTAETVKAMSRLPVSSGISGVRKMLAADVAIIQAFGFTY